MLNALILNLELHFLSLLTKDFFQGSAYVTHPSEAYDLFLTSAIADGIKLWDLRTDR